MDFGVTFPQADGTILLESGDSQRMIQGSDLLLQTVVIEICSDPLPNRGGSGFVTALKTMPLGASEARTILSSRLRLAEEDILKSQRDANLTDEERLQSLDIIDLREGSDGWEADLAMMAVSGTVLQRTFA